MAHETAEISGIATPLWARNDLNSTEKALNGSVLLGINNRNLTFALCAAVVMLCIVPAHAQDSAPMFSFPAACDIGETCMVQNYFDHDPGPGAKDYQCGFLSYDGHDGTDIRLPNLAAMKKGVHVLAAADGLVRAIRDSMDDMNFREVGKDEIKGKEAGNSVIIDHGNGWETQYSHLGKGSVLVKPNEPVKRGQALGLIGLSGWTEFPHLHLTVRHNGRKIDPFVGPGKHRQCGLGARPVWDAITLATLKYVPTGVLTAGFAGDVPNFEQIKLDTPPVPSATAPALVFWINTYGVQTGDDEHIRIFAPDGRLFSETRRQLSAHKADWFAYAGKKRRDAPWQAGTYRGEYTLTRDGKAGPQQIISVVREIHVSH